MDEKKTFRAQATDALNAADECVSGFDKIAIIERAIRAAWESGYADSAEHLESQRALGRAAVQRAERAEDQERYLTERIHGTAEGGGLVRRVEELEAALRGCERYLDECGPLLASDDPESGVHEMLAQIRAALATEPAPTPRSALCHHQDRTHCAGCPDDVGCEASGREPRGTT